MCIFGTLTRRIIFRLAALWSCLFDRVGNENHKALKCRRARMFYEVFFERIKECLHVTVICMPKASVGLNNVAALLDKKRRERVLRFG